MKKKSDLTHRAVIVVAIASIIMAISPSSASAAQIGDCELALDNPHPSIHNEDHFASSNAVIKCKNKHKALKVSAKLWHRFSGYPEYVRQYDGPDIDQPNANYASSAAVADECVNGDLYGARADYTIVDDGNVESRVMVTSAIMSRC